MNCLRIGLVTDEFPPARITGGIGAYTAYQARLLAAGGHEVHVFCQADGLEKVAGDVRIHPVAPLEAPTRALRFAYHRTLGPLLGPLQRRARWGLAVGRAIRQIETARGAAFDAVEIPEAGGYAGFVRRGGARGPLIVRLHIGNALLARLGGCDDRGWQPAMARLERWSIRAADLVTAPSRAVVRAEAADLGLDPERVLIYPNACPQPADAPAGLPERESHLVVTVGKLCTLKGADLVLEAYARVLASRPELQLVMIGRNALGPELRARAAALGLPDHALPGEVPPARVREWLHRAALVIVASRFESFSLVTVEAMRARALVIAADAGALPELVTHERTGLLFESGRADALATAIERALANPDQARAWAAAGQAWAATALADDAVREAACAAYAAARTRARASRQRQVSA